jgi:hypothetical protein
VQRTNGIQRTPAWRDKPIRIFLERRAANAQ